MNDSPTNFAWLDAQERMLREWLADLLLDPKAPTNQVERLRAHLEWLRSERDSVSDKTNTAAA